MEIPSITAKTRLDFRRWLARNHSREKRVAIILNKRHTGISAPSHRELLEEAICFGWVDTTIKRLDDNQFVRHFARRNGNSRWSENTQSYARQLIKEGRMTPTGLKFYREGLTRPTHDHGIPKNPDMPVELERALKKDKKAREGFEKFSPSVKRAFYRWLLRGKRDETRKKRVKQIMQMAREGRKLGARKKDD